MATSFMSITKKKQPTLRSLLVLLVFLLAIFLAFTFVFRNGGASLFGIFRKFDFVAPPVKRYRPDKKTETPPPPAPDEEKSASLASQFKSEKILYYQADGFSRPEMCLSGNTAFVALRHTVGEGRNASNEIILKAFEIDSQEDWTDISSQKFSSSYSILYPLKGPDGSVTDHQLVCDSNGFDLIFETVYQSNKQNMKRTVLYRFDSKWQFQKKQYIFNDIVNLVTYKMDDPGVVLLDGMLYIWVVKLNSSHVADGFALYGIDPVTLETKISGASSSPIVLSNPDNAPFTGVLYKKNGDFFIMTSPKDPAGRNFDQNGLVEYRYSSDWKYIDSKKIEHDFGGLAPVYVTGYLRQGNLTLWGFTLEDTSLRETRNLQIGKEFIGEAWVFVEKDDGTQDFFKVSDNDSTPDSNDTRHTVLEYSNGKLIVGYKHVVDPRATTIRRFSFPTQ